MSNNVNICLETQLEVGIEDIASIDERNSNPIGAKLQYKMHKRVCIGLRSTKIYLPFYQRIMTLKKLHSSSLCLEYSQDLYHKSIIVFLSIIRSINFFLNYSELLS